MMEAELMMMEAELMMMEAGLHLTQINEEDKNKDEPQLHRENLTPESDATQTDVPVRPKAEGTRAASVNQNQTQTQTQPKPLHSLLSPSSGTCSVHQVISTDPENVKTTEEEKHEADEDLCAAVLLACLFCRPLDCVFAAVRCFHVCSRSLCWCLCGCEPSTLRPMLDPAHSCDACGCLGARCFMCDCPVCDICLQANECLELAMEMSQMLYH